MHGSRIQHIHTNNECTYNKALIKIAEWGNDGDGSHSKSNLLETDIGTTRGQWLVRAELRHGNHLNIFLFNCWDFFFRHRAFQIQTMYENYYEDILQAPRVTSNYASDVLCTFFVYKRLFVIPTIRLIPDFQHYFKSQTLKYFKSRQLE